MTEQDMLKVARDAVAERVARLVGDMPWVTKNLTDDQICDLKKQIAVSIYQHRFITEFHESWRSAQWEKKVWGEVLHLFASDSAAVSYLRVNKGFRCSKHYHEHRANQFTVISGKVLIQVRGSNVAGCDYQWLLEPGMTMTVESGTVHWFEVIESGEMVEVYWADRGGKVSIDDIVRQDEGGPIILAPDTLGNTDLVDAVPDSAFEGMKTEDELMDEM